mgnify:CR=1 FL=1
MLGTGVSSKVYYAIEKGNHLGAQFAIKTIEKQYFTQSSNFDAVIKELRIHRLISGIEGVV